ncbi:MAG: DeoR family transcriptional regulator [Clostridia bacterium]|nr:DeoR family transcriptional regulator [Clostridia bacterium]
MRCTTERRQLVLEYLLDQRHTTLDALCKEFEVSMSTMRRDILILSCSYPITTLCFRQPGNGSTHRD